MDANLSTNACPTCKNVLPMDEKDYPAGRMFACTYCGKYLIVIRHNGRVLLRPYLYTGDHTLYNEDDVLQTLIACVEIIMPLEKYGFDKSIQFWNNDRQPIIIYNSEYCRVKFSLGNSGYGPTYGSFVFYGRLHAPDDHQHMKWKGEVCTCWHSNIYLIIPFLSGISPQQAAENRGNSVQALVDSINRDYPNMDHIEYPLRLHSKIWDTYGKKLFTLFDLRQAGLWRDYVQFTNEYWNIFYGQLVISHSPDKIC